MSFHLFKYNLIVNQNTPKTVFVPVEYLKIPLQYILLGFSKKTHAISVPCSLTYSGYRSLRQRYRFSSKILGRFGEIVGRFGGKFWLLQWHNIVRYSSITTSWMLQQCYRFSNVTIICVLCVMWCGLCAYHHCLTHACPFINKYGAIFEVFLGHCG